MNRIRPHLTYANVMVSLLAVMVIGGGGAYAAELAANDSVDSRAIIDGEVKDADIQNKAEFARGLERDAVYVRPSGPLTKDDVRTLPPNTETEVGIFCRDGDIAINGGVRWLGGVNGQTAGYPDSLRSRPVGPEGWITDIRNQANVDRSYVGYVVCIKAR